MANRPDTLAYGAFAVAEDGTLYAGNNTNAAVEQAKQATLAQEITNRAADTATCLRSSAQTLTAEQQTRARTNIGAAAQAELDATNTKVAGILDAVYPVGSIYMSVVSTSPATLFGGTWERLKDRFLLGAGDTYTAGATGGEAMHTLTVNEMPQHMHDGQSNWIDYVQMGGTGNNRLAFCVGGGATPAAGGFTNVTGGNGAHNNMPPYLVVYMWKRTA